MPALLALAFFVVQALAQTITPANWPETITDPSAPWWLTERGAQELGRRVVTNTKTNTTGYYHFAYLKPGNYSVTVIGSGFQSSQKK